MHPRQQFLSRTACNDRGPAHQVRARPEKHENPAVPRRSGLEPAAHPKAVRPAWLQRGRRRREPLFAPLFAAALSARPLLARGPAFQAAGQDLSRQPGQPGRGSRPRRRRSDIDSPQGAADREQVARIINLLMAEEFGPCAVRRITEIMGQLAGAVPSPCGLRRIFLQEGKARVGVAECDHTTDDAVRARASCRTRSGPSSSGVHGTPSIPAGVLPSRSLRGRSNQRRIPKSL